MKTGSALLGLMLPNRAFRRRVRGLPPGRRRAYWILRIALAAAAVLVIVLFGIQQHPQLH